jgi:DNA-directed RNA polymerase specialized sigma24 family protein
VKETAAALGCAEGTVKANGYHAIRRLRKILRKMESPAGELESDDTSAL